LGIDIPDASVGAIRPMGRKGQDTAYGEELLVLSTQLNIPSATSGSARARFDENEMASGSRKGIEYSMY
jgi:hypothetical protein